MWRFRLKLLAWWGWPHVMLWLCCFLLATEDYMVWKLLWCGLVITLLAAFCWPPYPKKPLIKWWVVSRVRRKGGWSPWNDEAWSLDKKKVLSYVKTCKEAFPDVEMRLEAREVINE
jgi:hypothetical protein